MKESVNSVTIEGILSEINLEEGSYVKNGNSVPRINGSVTIKVDDNEIPVHVFVGKYKNDGNENPAYTSIKDLKDNFKSIAVAGIDNADAVRITNAKISMNEFPRRDGSGIISYPRIRGTFINKIKKNEMKPKARFEVEFMVANMIDEVNKDGEETGRLQLKGIVSQYGGMVDVVPFFVENAAAIDAIRANWEENSTVKATGKLNFSSKVETILDKSGFGEPVERTKVTNISDLVITGGTPEPYDEDFAFDVEEISKALAERKARLEEMKENFGKKTSAPKKATPKMNIDLGF